MRRLASGMVLLAAFLAACVAAPTPTPSASPAETPGATPTPDATAVASATPSSSPTPTPEPPLSLDPPAVTDPRRVAVSLTPEISRDGGGRIVVTVTSVADSMVDELVLRWPTELGSSLFLAPFTPSDERIREGGPPLVQPWTKWVIGPGEQGEPAGTTSLGWGPLLAGATLEIPIVVTRIAPGPVAFDLQLLSRNDLLTLEDGSPAELRVDVP